jgi:hypothetical protein
MTSLIRNNILGIKNVCKLCENELLPKIFKFLFALLLLVKAEVAQLVEHQLPNLQLHQ